MGFSARLAFGHAPVEVDFRLGKMMGLGQDDEVEDMIEPSVAASIEAVTDSPSRRSLERSGPRVSCELGV